MPTGRSPLSPDFFVQVRLANDITKREVTFFVLGPDPNTAEISARKGKKILEYLAGPGADPRMATLGTSGPQNWRLEPSAYCPIAKAYSFVAYYDPPKTPRQPEGIPA